jgi:hypothetical protein
MYSNFLPKKKVRKAKKDEDKNKPGERLLRYLAEIRQRITKMGT